MIRKFLLIILTSMLKFLLPGILIKIYVSVDFIDIDSKIQVARNTYRGIYVEKLQTCSTSITWLHVTPGYYLKHRWIIVNWTLGALKHILLKCDQDYKTHFKKRSFENDVWKSCTIRTGVNIWTLHRGWVTHMCINKLGCHWLIYRLIINRTLYNKLT